MSIRLFTKIHVFLVFISLLFIVNSNHLASASDSDFEKLQRGHFIIHHNNKNLANKVSWKAEYYYKRIVRHLGVREFRPWEGEDKCPIYIYKTKDDYLKDTGAPDWSRGVALNWHIKSSTNEDIPDFVLKQLLEWLPCGRISSYEDASDFLENILPHEMTHMLLYLFMDKKPIPLWLNEGMAQFEEKPSLMPQRKKLLRWHIKNKTYIKFNQLFQMEKVPKDKIGLFYVESATIVEHLITDNIRASFGKFLMCVKNGDTIEEALKKSYQWKYKNGISDLEQKWLDFIRWKY